MLGEHIRALRINLGLSQQELARKIGTSQQHVSFIENNERLPSLKILRKIAETFQVTIDELVSEK